MNNLNYGIIGNSRTAALISDRGRIEWLCFPDFDSPSVFAALLDRAKGGSFGFEVSGSYAVRQSYVPHTNILSTRFSADEGEFEVLDYMPCYRSFEKEHYLPAELYRYIRLVRGRPRLAIDYAPAPNYARGEVSLARHARVCRNVQLVRPERPPVPLLLPPARRDRRTARNHAREGRIPAALLQREGHPDRHRTREDRILPHAGLLAQLDEPHEEVQLLQRRHREEHARAEAPLLLQRRHARGRHHEPARDDRRGTQLGLPVLLAARRLHVHRNDVPRGTRRGRPPLHEIHPIHALRQPRLPDHVRHPRRTDADRDDARPPRGLRRVAPRTHRQ